MEWLIFHGFNPFFLAFENGASRPDDTQLAGEYVFEALEPPTQQPPMQMFGSDVRERSH